MTLPAPPLVDLMRRQEELRRLEELRNQELQRRKQMGMRCVSCRGWTLDGRCVAYSGRYGVFSAHFLQFGSLSEGMKRRGGGERRSWWDTENRRTCGATQRASNRTTWTTWVQLELVCRDLLLRGIIAALWGILLVWRVQSGWHGHMTPCIAYTNHKYRRLCRPEASLESAGVMMISRISCFSF